MRKLVAPAIGAIATVVLLIAPTAQAESKYADIRVVTNDGTQLAEHRQYTGRIRVNTLDGSDCFGSPSSGDRYTLKRPNMLGTLIDASKNDADLDPLAISDAFRESFGFGVCGIGGFETEGFSYWYYAINGVGGTTAADDIKTRNGDWQLWYLTRGDEPGFPSELVLKAPPRAVAGEKFTVRVIRVKPDGSKKEARNVDVTGAIKPTNRNGKTRVVLPPGSTSLVASGRRDDVPSGQEPVCAALDLSDCPKHRGIRIFGSRFDDEIEATKGPDEIACGSGIDIVREVRRSDQVADDCEKVRR